MLNSIEMYLIHSNNDHNESSPNILSNCECVGSMDARVPGWMNEKRDMQSTVYNAAENWQQIYLLHFCVTPID